MAYTADLKIILQTLTAADKTNAQLKSIARKYCKRHGFSNPWDEEANPVEYAAWPTLEEQAEFMVVRMRNQLRSEVGSVAGQEHDEAQIGSREAAILAAQAEIK